MVNLLTIIFIVISICAATPSNSLAKESNSATNSSKANELNELAKKYLNGIGVVMNKREAFNLYSKAAKLGSARAQNELGNMYSNGIGTETNCNEAVKWYTKASNQNYSNAKENLISFYYYGNCGAKDKNKAFELCTKFAKNGDSTFMKRLAALYMADSDNRNMMLWFTKAANNNDPEAQRLLGCIYNGGFESIPSNLNKSIYWLQRSTENGDQIAPNLLLYRFKWDNNLLRQCFGK